MEAKGSVGFKIIQDLDRADKLKGRVVKIVLLYLTSTMKTVVRAVHNRMLKLH